MGRQITVLLEKGMVAVEVDQEEVDQEEVDQEEVDLEEVDLVDHNPQTTVHLVVDQAVVEADQAVVEVVDLEVVVDLVEAVHQIPEDFPNHPEVKVVAVKGLRQEMVTILEDSPAHLEAREVRAVEAEEVLVPSLLEADQTPVDSPAHQVAPAAVLQGLVAILVASA